MRVATSTTAIVAARRKHGEPLWAQASYTEAGMTRTFRDGGPDQTPLVVFVSDKETEESTLGSEREAARVVRQIMDGNATTRVIVLCPDVGKVDGIFGDFSKTNLDNFLATVAGPLDLGRRDTRDGLMQLLLHRQRTEPKKYKHCQHWRLTSGPTVGAFVRRRPLTVAVFPTARIVRKYYNCSTTITLMEAMYSDLAIQMLSLESCHMVVHDHETVPLSLVTMKVERDPEYYCYSGDSSEECEQDEIPFSNVTEGTLKRLNAINRGLLAAGLLEQHDSITARLPRCCTTFACSELGWIRSVSPQSEPPSMRRILREATPLEIEHLFPALNYMDCEAGRRLLVREIMERPGLKTALCESWSQFVQRDFERVLRLLRVEGCGSPAT